MNREFFKRVGVNKVYEGQKSVNVNVDSDQALELAFGIIKACQTHKKVDLVFFTKKIQKRSGGKIPQGKIVATVTAAGD